MIVSQLSTQGLVPDSAPTVTVKRLEAQNCDILQILLNSSVGSKLLGVSLRHTDNGHLDTVALSTQDTVYLIPIHAGRKSSLPKKGSVAPRTTNLTQVLESPHCMLAGFSMPRVAILLHRHTRAQVRGIDLSTLHSKSTREQTSAAELASKHLHPQAHERRIHALWLRISNEALCLRAWLSARIAEQAHALKSAAKVDTRNLQPHELACLSQLVLNVELLDADKPTSYENDFDCARINSKGHLELYNARYKTRVRASGQTTIEINGGEIKAQAVGAKGRQTILTGNLGKSRSLKVNKVRVVGREEPTSAELSRDEFLLLLLQKAVSLRASSFVCLLWFHNGSKALKRIEAAKHSHTHFPSFEKLNDSQRQVALAMIGDKESLVIAHGPPGTGKTTTIATALNYWEGQRKPAWVIAHSNVGVKNIAVSLFERKIDFKIIVSKEFHFDWHEHIYADIERNLIRSDEFGDEFDPRIEIGETKVILCTLSMLSNPALDNCGVFDHLPVERLVVDEASQIDTFEFMHLFHKFCKKLTKVCMFGDPKQLPPFGKEVAPKMKTIFDFKQFHSSAYFLDTQYRMPVPLGKFISKAVYESKLKSVHKIADRSCVLFVDVRKGREEHAGQSWKNTEEVHTIVNIVKNYYRHKDNDLCIITPYDAQRAAIVTALKAADLPSEQVYNVDSFQGHEAPYVVVSAVRTSKPGFLQSLNRMNVMLTRCKAGMVLVTQRTFLCGSGQSTLLGRLANHWEKLAGAGAGAGANTVWADAMEIADGRANLPGAPGKRAMQEVARRANRRRTVGLVDQMSALSLID